MNKNKKSRNFTKNKNLRKSNTNLKLMYNPSISLMPDNKLNRMRWCKDVTDRSLKKNKILRTQAT